MDDLYLSFRTEDSAETAEWSRTGEAILRELGLGLESIGFAIDHEAGRHEPDWVFVARRAETAFGLSMSIANFTPCRWFIALVDAQSLGANIQSPDLRQEVHPVMQSVIESWPGVSEVRWHKDHTTLRDLQAARLESE
jgi:hypothetical protein